MKLTATTSTGSNISSKYKSHVLFFLLLCNRVLFFISIFMLPFLRFSFLSQREELMITTFSDYNWYVMRCDVHLFHSRETYPEHFVCHFCSCFKGAFGLKYMYVYIFKHYNVSKCILDSVAYANEIVLTK